MALAGVVLLAVKALSRKDEPVPEPASKRTPEPRPTQSAIWPIDEKDIVELGQSVMTDRNGKGRPHKGVDIYAASGTVVRASTAGRVLRVVDGRSSTDEKRRDAGLWVDVLGDDKHVYRYLHLGSADVSQGQTITRGARIGVIAPANTSGLGKRPHLHFEIRESDYLQLNKDYGRPIDPVAALPARK